jgi:GNAT superfamily N-acetyltransferase
MIRRATESEVEALTRLINRAFEVERFFIYGDRIDAAGTLQYFGKGTFLVEDGEESPAACADTPSACADTPSACVYVELRGERAYFGLLSIDPARQRSGLGKTMIAAAEDFGRAAGCRFMDINVVNLREELPPYYRSLGYSESGKSPFPAGAPTKLPCHFIHMSKAL